MSIFTIIAVVLICVGLLFFLGAAVGIMRFGDFYTRMHAAGKGDTLSSLLVLLGFGVYQLNNFQSFSESWPVLLVILKLIAISAFILLTSPTATHALMDSGWEDGIEPELKNDKPETNALEEDMPQPKQKEAQA